MNGLGFMVWKLSNMPPINRLLPLLQSAEVAWISVKVADGIYKYNTQGGNDSALIAWIEALQDAGIEVGGWHYVYPTKPGPQGDLAEERREKLGLSHYLLDVEGEWKGTYAPAARTLCDKLHNGSLTAGLCSYRYPHMHPIPWSAFMAHDKIDVMTPQVYWVGSHNPGAQLVASESEYAHRTAKPFIPIGSTFGMAGWEPSVDDLVSFVDTCELRQYQAFGFYSLDWIITHSRTDWLHAISEAAGSLPPPPVEPVEFVVSNCAWLNGRTDPDSSIDNRIISVKAGQHVTNLLDQNGDWRKCGLGPVTCWMHGDYLEPA